MHPIEPTASPRSARTAASINNGAREELAKASLSMRDDGAGAVRSQTAETVPIDTARVRELADAIAAGRYALTPERLADAMIARGFVVEKTRG